MNKIGRSEPNPCVHIYPYDSFLKKKSILWCKKKSCVGLSHLSLFEFFFVEDNPLRCFDVAQPISIEQHRSRYKHVLVIYTQSTVID